MVDLAENIHLFLQANHPRNPSVENGDIDWDRVTRVKVMCIGSCYG